MGIRKGVSRKKLYNAYKSEALAFINVDALKKLFYTEKASEERNRNDAIQPLPFAIFINFLKKLIS